MPADEREWIEQMERARRLQASEEFLTVRPAEGYIALGVCLGSALTVAVMLIIRWIG